MMLTVDEYMALRRLISSERESEGSSLTFISPKTGKSEPNTPKKRRASAYSRKYKAAFKKVSPRFKKKNGQWKTNGFRAAVRAAHKEAKK
tara:strand:+ start:278 stop:547 length:270 start_codon:yes stop_codon:yes gene_type:complete